MKRFGITFSIRIASERPLRYRKTWQWDHIASKWLYAIPIIFAQNLSNSFRISYFISCLEAHARPRAKATLSDLLGASNFAIHRRPN